VGGHTSGGEGGKGAAGQQQQQQQRAGPAAGAAAVAAAVAAAASVQPMSQPCHGHDSIEDAATALALYNVYCKLVVSVREGCCWSLWSDIGREQYFCWRL